MIQKTTDIFQHLEKNEAGKNLSKLKKKSKTLKQGGTDSVDYDDLGNYDDNYGFADDDDGYSKIGSVRRLSKSLTEVITNQ